MSEDKSKINEELFRDAAYEDVIKLINVLRRIQVTGFLKTGYSTPLPNRALLLSVPIKAS